MILSLTLNEAEKLSTALFRLAFDEHAINDRERFVCISLARKIDFEHFEQSAAPPLFILDDEQEKMMKKAFSREYNKFIQKYQNVEDKIYADVCSQDFQLQKEIWAELDYCKKTLKEYMAIADKLMDKKL